MPVFETSDFSCQKNLRVSSSSGSENRLFQDPMKSYENPMVYGNVQLFFQMKLPFWGIPLGPKVSDLDSKKPLVWSSGTGEGALGRGACSLLSWKPMDTMGFYRSKSNDHLGLSQEK